MQKLQKRLSLTLIMFISQRGTFLKSDGWGLTLTFAVTEPKWLSHPNEHFFIKMCIQMLPRVKRFIEKTHSIQLHNDC